MYNNKFGTVLITIPTVGSLQFTLNILAKKK